MANIYSLYRISFWNFVLKGDRCPAYTSQSWFFSLKIFEVLWTNFVVVVVVVAIVVAVVVDVITWIYLVSSQSNKSFIVQLQEVCITTSNIFISNHKLFKDLVKVECKTVFID